jgi:hypothetical protein
MGRRVGRSLGLPHMLWHLQQLWLPRRRRWRMPPLGRRLTQRQRRTLRRTTFCCVLPHPHSQVLARVAVVVAAVLPHLLPQPTSV